MDQRERRRDRHERREDPGKDAQLRDAEHHQVERLERDVEHQPRTLVGAAAHQRDGSPSMMTKIASPMVSTITIAGRSTPGRRGGLSALADDLLEALGDGREEGLTIDSPEQRVDDPLGMGHQSEHVSALVTDTRDVVERTVRRAAFRLPGPVGLAVAQDDLTVRLEALECLGVARVVALVVVDRDADDRAGRGRATGTCCPRRAATPLCR